MSEKLIRKGTENTIFLSRKTDMSETKFNIIFGEKLQIGSRILMHLFFNVVLHVPVLRFPRAINEGNTNLRNS